MLRLALRGFLFTANRIVLRKAAQVLLLSGFGRDLFLGMVTVTITVTITVKVTVMVKVTEISSLNQSGNLDCGGLRENPTVKNGKIWLGNAITE